MNLNNISDEHLLERTEKLVAQEREILVDVLRHLQEIERRKLYSALRYTSLFDYAVKKLKYSEDRAWRRVSAMRLMTEVPEMAEKLNSGSLTLTNIGMAQTLFRKEKMAGVKKWNRAEKLAVLENLQNQPKREAEKVILRFSSVAEVLSLDKIKAVSENQIEINFVAPEELQTKIDHLKGLLAYKFPTLSLAKLFDNLCELGLDKYDPCRSAPRAARANHVKVQ
jgi:hypothetical protein